jgi:hypothetical protein
VPVSDGIVQMGTNVTFTAAIYHTDNGPTDVITDVVHAVKVTWEFLDCDGGDTFYDLGQVVQAHSWLYHVAYGGPAAPQVSITVPCSDQLPAPISLPRFVHHGRGHRRG